MHVFGEVNGVCAPFCFRYLQCTDFSGRSVDIFNFTKHLAKFASYKQRNSSDKIIRKISLSPNYLINLIEELL